VNGDGWSQLRATNATDCLSSLNTGFACFPSGNVPQSKWKGTPLFRVYIIMLDYPYVIINSNQILR
jgi:hypothetical protein